MLGSCAEIPPTQPASKLSDIDHIAILMKENRSFDHCFGTLGSVRGYDDLTAALGLGAAPRCDVPKLPDTAARLAEVERTVLDLPVPAVPAKQWMPTQEQGAGALRRGAAWRPADGPS